MTPLALKVQLHRQSKMGVELEGDAELEMQMLSWRWGFELEKGVGCRWECAAGGGAVELDMGCRAGDGGKKFVMGV